MTASCEVPTAAFSPAFGVVWSFSVLQAWLQTDTHLGHYHATSNHQADNHQDSLRTLAFVPALVHDG